ncbi:MAG: hypothetical protein H6842_04955 [Rhodospirillaceae bacterium]|nr:hypothetical protein [Rhodospirillaceae bacterium]
MRIVPMAWLAAWLVAPHMAQAQTCDIATEVQEIAPIFQAKVQSLSADPTAENMALITALSEMFTEAGTLVATDPAAACDRYAKLRRMLEM